jgi:hypothetical protein
MPKAPSRELLRGEHRAYLEDGLRLLSPRERQALMLRDVEGLPADSCEHTGLLEGHGAFAYFHARTKLRGYMEEAVDAMKHPVEILACDGGDLGWMARWKTARHAAANAAPWKWPHSVNSASRCRG